MFREEFENCEIRHGNELQKQWIGLGFQTKYLKALKYQMQFTETYARHFLF